MITIVIDNETAYLIIIHKSYNNDNNNSNNNNKNISNNNKTNKKQKEWKSNQNIVIVIRILRGKPTTRMISTYNMQEV